MNIFDLNTKEKLDNYAAQVLVVTEGIDKSEITGFNRAVALLNFNADFRNKSITLVVGIYELDELGEPIISKSLKPYEEVIIANNGRLVDVETFEIADENELDESKTYLGEYDAYIALTKSSSIKLWELFENVIKSSPNIN
jgi:hypothetical protein